MENIATGDLQSHITKCIVLSCCFDIVIANVEKCLSSTINFSAYLAKLMINTPKIRFVDERIDGNWDEKSSSNGHSFKIYQNESDAILGAMQRVGVDLVVIRDRQSVPVAVKS